MNINNENARYIANEMYSRKEIVIIYLICASYEINNEKKTSVDKLNFFIDNGYKIINGDIDSISDNDLCEFLNMYSLHTKKLTEKYNTFDDLPFKKLLNRFELLNELNVN